MPSIQDYQLCLAEYERALAHMIKAQFEPTIAGMVIDGLDIPYGRLAELYSDIVALKTLRWELTQSK